MSLRLQHVPNMWKDAINVPVLKYICPRMPNEFRPVDLKSVLMKIIESRVRSEIFRMTESLFDPMQSTCRYKGGYIYIREVQRMPQ